jgi:hypothetical protein
MKKPWGIVTREYAPLNRNNLRTPLPRTYIEVGKIVFGSLASYYEKDIPAVFVGVEDAPLQ